MIHTPESLKVNWDSIHAQVDEWIGKLTDKSNHLFVDFETYFDNDYSLRKKDMTYTKYVKSPLFQVHTLQAALADGEVQYIVGEEDIRAFLEEYVNEDTVLIAQNTMFDGLIVTEHFGLRPGFYLDTLGMSRALHPHDMSHSLEMQAYREFPDDQTKWKVSGESLDIIKGLRQLTDWHHTYLKPYGIRDTEVLRHLFYNYLDKGFPERELYVIHMLLRNFCEPEIEADIPLLERTLVDATRDQDQAVDAALNYLMANADLPAYFWTPTDDRDKTAFKTIKSYETSYRSAFGDNKPIRNRDEMIKFLSSNDKFVYVLQRGFGIDVKKKPSPTPKDKFNETWALGKDDVEFQEMMAQHRKLEVVWNGRIFSKSNIAKTRAVSMLETAECLNGKLPIPLKYAAAHTHRFGGGEKLNFQNFGRGSNHRLALRAEEGKLLMVRDSSNIESRLSAYFCEHEDKIELFRNGGDPYNATATPIFGYEVNRKSKDVDHSVQGAVGKATELGCGYQMGHKRFKNFLNAGPLGMPPIFLEDIAEMQQYSNPYKYVIDTYRETNWPTRNMWGTLAGVIRDMWFEDMDNQLMCGVTAKYQRLELPSGLALHYPKIQQSRENGWNFRSKDGWKKIFGGSLLENIIQALARILICEQMIYVDAYMHVNKLGRVVLQVHDEIIAHMIALGATRKATAPMYTEGGAEAFDKINKENGYQVYENTELLDCVSAAMHEIMVKDLPWCEGIPLNSEGGYDYCYSK